MRGNTLYKVSDPVNPQDVATKEYADKVGGGEAAIVKTQYGNYIGIYRHARLYFNECFGSRRCAGCSY